MNVKSQMDNNMKSVLTKLQLIKFENPRLKNGELAKKMERTPQNAYAISKQLAAKLEKLGYTNEFIEDAVENPGKYFIATRPIPEVIMKSIIKEYGTVAVLTETIEKQRPHLMLDNDWRDLLETRAERMWRTYPFNLISWTFGFTSDEISSHSGYVNIDSETQMFLATMWIEGVVRTCGGGERIHDMLVMRCRDHKNLEEVGKKYNITRDRVRQLIAKAERQLRHPSRSKKLRIVADMIFNSNGEVNFADIISAYERQETFKEMMRTELSKQNELQNKMKQSGCDLNAPIENLNLSVRSYNCLKRAGINTVENIITRFQNESPDEILLSVRNLGRKSYDEICNVLRGMGYVLR